MKLRVILLLTTLLFCANLAFSAVLSQWRGPNRDGIYAEKNLAKTWPAVGPKLLWSAKNLGIGFSSPAVTPQAVYVTSLVKGEGRLFAFDHTGKELWQAVYGPEWDSGHKSARSTPAVVDDKIYVITGLGQVVCAGANGKILWSVDTVKEFGARILQWGHAESPLVDGELVFCTVGSPKALMVALNRHTGKTVWQSKSTGELSAYCSPAIFNHNSARLLVTQTEKSVVALDPDSGALLWSQPHVTQYDINPNTPIYQNGFLHTFSGYGSGGQLFQISADGKSAKKVWANDTPDNQMAGAVLIDGYVYTSGHKNRGWGCLDWKTGVVQWQSREYGGKGPLIAADGMLYLYSEKGDVVLAKANPKAFEPVSAFTMADGAGEHWAHPVIANGRLYIRHGDVMNVYDVAAK